MPSTQFSSGQRIQRSTSSGYADACPARTNLERPGQGGTRQPAARPRGELASRTTPGTYLRYLEERRYDYYVAGSDHVDLTLALVAMEDRYRPTVIVTDRGGTLTPFFCAGGSSDEVSLVVAPVIVGGRSRNLFRVIEEAVDVQLIRTESVAGYARLVYRVAHLRRGARR